ncbi:rRNA maturation RNase YbeY [Candidatus Pelagibacter sp.]|jgi:probable rRNA maturation factor|nr:rRNA maturation RNase YbeY [Candidatus Pelagibacter sp.]MDA9670425.1 rRNA maturation RNase YbeY [Candidatus Pelagibacter sp.]MDB4153759.1 rRNA maturation RNase YbeY [Candidatus Pelagibacter sp.]MDC1272472.1 rRNA maturation RNase YbeY [Pelagibacteraceae bacterium]MDC1454352.1 rRNA maturation RNase YbeY [Pelagibacteraceae bacterium]
MINIDVLSDEKAWSKKIKKKELFFREICNFFPRKYRFPNKKITLSLLLSNNKFIKKLNKNFRNKNKSTDILSFPLAKKTKISKKTYIGDIIISYNFMNKPKSQNIKNFKKKVIKTFIHGYLHLLGFDHIKDKDYKRMLSEEEKIYKSVILKIN